MTKIKRVERRSRTIIRTIIIGVVMMMGFLSKIAMSRSFDDYHYLSENAVQSENYEVVKLIHGDIDAVLHIEGTNTIIVMAAGYLWKINEHGHLVDTLRGMYALRSSGIELWTDSWSDSTGKNFWYKKFHDWIVSGDRIPRTIRATDIQSSKNLSDSELINQLIGRISLNSSTSIRERTRSLIYAF